MRPRKVYLIFLLLLGVGLILTDSQLLVRGRAAVAEVAPRQTAPTRFEVNEPITLHAADRGNPWINLKDGHDLHTLPAGHEPLLIGQALQPLSLASADFDEDGVPDLVSSYASSDHGVLILHRGNADSIYPNSPEARQHKAQGTFTDSPFPALMNRIEIPITPDFIGTGDFDADRHQDVVVASMGSRMLFRLRGDGHGGLIPASPVELPGNVTALVAGEINRADGLTDLAVGVSGPGGAQVLIFEGARGAWQQQQPEVITLPAPATSLALGQLDDQYPFDLAVAAGHQLLIVQGRDRSLYLNEGLRGEVHPPLIKRLNFDFEITSIAVGRFSGERNDEIALLAADGVIRLLKCNPQSANQGWGELAGEVRAVSQPAPSAFTLSASAARAPRLVRASLSSRPNDDLVVVDPGNRQLQIVMGEMLLPPPASAAPASSIPVPRRPVTLDVEGEPAAVLPMRLNTDALNDLVVLKSGGQNSLAVSVTAATATFTVNTEEKGEDLHPGDGVCEDYNHKCSLGAALQEGNAGSGAFTVNFSVSKASCGAYGNASEATQPVTIDGTSMGHVELNGYLFIKGGNSAVRGLSPDPVYGGDVTFVGKGNNLIEDNYCIILTSYSDRNIVGGVRPEAINITPQLVINHSAETTVKGNYLGFHPDKTPWGNPSDRVEVTSGSQNCLIGGTENGASNSIYGGVLITGVSSNEQFPVAGIQVIHNVLYYVTCDKKTSGSLIGNNDLESSGGHGVYVNADSRNNIIRDNQITYHAQAGIYLEGPDNQVIGNLISANGLSGSVIAGIKAGPESARNIIRANWIGLYNTGNLASANNGPGIEISAPDNIVGGDRNSEGNLISGNLGPGIRLNSTARGTQIAGNWIGVQSDGASPLGNAEDGIVINGESTLVGGTDAWHANLIANNGRDGVSVGVGGKGNSIFGNQICCNRGLGIRIQAAPRPPVPQLTLNGDVLKGKLTGAAGTAYRVEFFGNQECDPSGSGEGGFLLGSLTVTTNGGGEAEFTPTVSLTQSRIITATATDPAGNTSEFSECAKPSAGIVLSPRLILGCTGDQRDIVVTEKGTNKDITQDPNIKYEWVRSNGLPASLINLVFDKIKSYLPNVEPQVANIDVSSGKVKFFSEGFNVVQAKRKLDDGTELTSNYAFVISSGLALSKVDSIELAPYSIISTPTNIAAEQINKALSKEMAINTPMILFSYEGDTCWGVIPGKIGSNGFIGLKSAKFSLFGGLVPDVDFMNAVYGLVGLAGELAGVGYFGELLSTPFAQVTTAQFLKYKASGDDPDKKETDAFISVAKDNSSPPFIRGQVTAKKSGISGVQATLDLSNWCLGKASGELLVIVLPDLEKADIRMESGRAEDPIDLILYGQPRPVHAVGMFNFVGAATEPFKISFDPIGAKDSEILKMAEKYIPGGQKIQSIGVPFTLTAPWGAELKDGLYQQGNTFARFRMTWQPLNTAVVIDEFRLQLPLWNGLTNWTMAEPAIATADPSTAMLNGVTLGTTNLNLEVCIPFLTRRYDTNPVRVITGDLTCVVTPDTETLAVGEQASVSASIRTANIPISGAKVNFEITSGPNKGKTGSDWSPGASFAYTGDGGEGEDIISVSASLAGKTASGTARKVWKKPVPVCQMSPVSANNPVGSDHTVLAVVTSDGKLVNNASVAFLVTSGPNTLRSGNDTTNSAGVAEFTYTGSKGAGTDTIEASGSVGGVSFTCNQVTKTWTPPVCSLTPPTSTGQVGATHSVTSTVTSDGKPLAGVTVNFAITGGPNVGKGGAGATNSTGQVIFNYTGDGGAGTDTIEGGGSVGGVPFSCTATRTWTTAPTKADLALSKSASPSPVLLGQNLTYTLVVSNNGPDKATGVTLTDNLPAGVTFISASASQGSCTGTGPVTCGIGELAMGTRATVTIVVRPDAPGNITNTARVTGGEGDPDGNNNSAAVTTAVRAADLSLTKAHSPAKVFQGQNLTYTLVARNNGPSDATGVRVTDTLPSAVTFVSAASTPGSCSGGAGAVTCDPGTLASGASATITIVVRTVQAGTVANTAVIAGNEPDPVQSNNTAADNAVVEAAPAIARITPSSAPQSSAGLEIKIEGVNFVPETIVSFQPDTGIEVIPPSPPDYGFVNPGEIRRRINIRADAPPGEREVFVTNPNGAIGGNRPFNVFTVTSAAGIAVSQSSIDFGSVPIGQNKSVNVMISNPGAAPLLIYGIAGNNPHFGVATAAVPSSLAAGANATVPVKFTPTAAGGQWGVLTIASNAPGRTSLGIQVQGASPPGQPQPEALATDDGSVETGAFDDDLIIVNRLTPSSYPVTLQTIRIFFAEYSDLPSPSGQTIRLIAFIDPAGSGRPPDIPELLVDQVVTIPQLPPGGAWVDFPVFSPLAANPEEAAGVMINSGDLYVGFHAPEINDSVVFAADSSGPQQQRAFFTYFDPSFFDKMAGLDNGQGDVIPVNIMIRAVMTPVSGTCSYSISPGIVAFGKEGGSSSFTVSAAPGCKWTVSAPADWIRIDSDVSNRSGTGTINFSVTANSSPRTGLVAAAGQKLIVRQAEQAVTVSAADYSGVELAAGSIVAGFGSGLATTVQAATTLPLPTTLAGTTVKVRDSAGIDRLAPLFFVSPFQVNYLIPDASSPGPAAVTITSGGGAVSSGTINLVAVVPSLFAANADGQGVGATYAVRVKADGTQISEPTYRYDEAQKKYFHIPIDLGPESDQVVLVLFGTGFRNVSPSSTVTVTVGGIEMPVYYAGPQPYYAGLDQVNLRLLRSLGGKGEVDIVVTVDGKTANTIRTFIK